MFSPGKVRILCSLTMYLSLSSRLTMPEYRSSILWRAECRDSAPCSPIMPAPMCHHLNHGMTWSSKMCIFGSTVAWGNSSLYSDMKSTISLSEREVRGLLRIPPLCVSLSYPVGQWLHWLVYHYCIRCGTCQTG